MATEQNSVAKEANSTQCTMDDIDLPAVDGMKISHSPSLTPVAHDPNGAGTQNDARQSKFTVSWLERKRYKK